MSDSCEIDDHIAARCPGCKSIVFIAKNTPRVMDGETRKDIVEMIKDGFNIEHITMAQFRASRFGKCQCAKQSIDGFPETT